METNESGRTEQIAKEVASYINLRYSALRLAAAENLATMFSSGFGLVVFLLLVTMSLLMFAGAFVLWLGAEIGSYIGSFAITGGILLLAALVIYLLRSKLVANAMVRMFCRMLFTSKSDYYEE